MTFWDIYADKILPEPNSGCWFWMGGLSERQYGVIYPSRGTNVRAHRVAYEMTRGPIPDGLVLDHLCRVHCCVNPDHLEAVTQGENVRRGFRPSRLPHHQRVQTAREKRKLWRQSSVGKASKRRDLDKRIAERAAARLSPSPQPY